MQSDSVIPEACNGHSQGHRRGQSQQVYPIFGLVHDFHTGGLILGKSTDWIDWFNEESFDINS